MEFDTEVMTVKVDMACDDCKDGLMRPTGIGLTSYPARYPHFCNKCGKHRNYVKTYPCIEYRDKD